MASFVRPKKKAALWKKATLHFSLCFVIGFFTGFTPISMFPSTYSPQPVDQERIRSFNTSSWVEPEEEQNHDVNDENAPEEETVEASFRRERTRSFNTSSWVELEEEQNHDANDENAPEEETDVRRLVIVVTPTSGGNKVRGVLLRRLAATLRLVAQPLLWIVVEQKSDDPEVSEILRRAGIMYRHVVLKENVTNVGSEMDHMRNVALNHIEHHRLSGIVHFAGLSNVYDLSFFEEKRAVEAFGTWAIAKVSANRKKVIIEGPVCEYSEVVGWNLKRMNNTFSRPPPHLHISSFAFNSSILWDPERWGRTSSLHHSSQNSLRFVRKEVVEEETKLKGIPAKDCSKVLLWDLHIPHQQ